MRLIGDHPALNGRSPTEGIHDLPFQMHEGATFLLAGDPEVGPLGTFFANPPRTEAPPLSPAHGHATDTWRITIQGVMTMGRARYGRGDFRFQEGGKPYGRDDGAWGPNGSFAFVLAADWRGVPMRTVNPADQPGDGGRSFLKGLLDLDCPERYPGRPAVATSVGVPGRGGGLEGSFDDAHLWTPVADGVRLAVGLAGDPDRGPVLLLVRAESRAMAFPATCLDTETMHLVVTGSGHAGSTPIASGHVRVVEAGAQSPAVVAGEAGLADAVLVADRRALRSALESSVIEAHWAATIAEVLDATQRLLTTTSTAD